MKTKAEILKSKTIDYPFVITEKSEHHIHAAMDEYAQQTAMDFAEWCIVHAWEIDYREQKSHTISKLFAKFEAERNQQQSELTCPECLSNRILEWPDKYQCRKCEHVWERSVK
jgi:hypothetical protein